jgi:hypothetical protein
MLTSTTTKKKSTIQREILFVAIMLTLLVHGLLLVLFVYTPSKKVYNNRRTAGITFMNLANQAPGKRRELLNWLEYHEPSLISAPNAKYGYNQLNPYKSFRKARPDKKYQAVLATSPKSSLKEFDTLNMHKQRQNDSSDDFIFHHIGQVPKSFKAVKPKSLLPEVKFPLVRHNDIVLKLSLSSYLLKDAEKLKAKSMSINYNLEQSELLPRVVIVDSSGNRDFDMSVLRELSLQIDNISRDRKDFTIKIQWRREASK